MAKLPIIVLLEMDILLWDLLRDTMPISQHSPNKSKTKYLVKDYSLLLYKLFAQTMGFTKWQLQEKIKSRSSL